jgi:hypothetical protein
MVGTMAKSGGKTKKQPDEAPRANRARPVSDMLPQVGGAAFRRFGFVQSSIVSRWREIVGDRYARVCAPESIRFPPGKRSSGVLNLVVEGAHAPTIQHVVPVIVERVNRFFGYSAIERVQFRQGIVQVAAAKARAAPPSLRPIPADLGDSLRGIADPELRACLEALARGVAESGGAGAPTSTLAIPLVGRIGERKK